MRHDAGRVRRRRTRSPRSPDPQPAGSARRPAASRSASLLPVPEDPRRVHPDARERLVALEVELGLGTASRRLRPRHALEERPRSRRGRPFASIARRPPRSSRGTVAPRGRRSRSTSATGPKWEKQHRASAARVRGCARYCRPRARGRSRVAASPGGARRTSGGWIPSASPGEDGAGRRVHAGRRDAWHGRASRARVERAVAERRSLSPSPRLRIRCARNRVDGAEERGHALVPVDPRGAGDELRGSARCGAPRSCTHTVARGNASAIAPTPPAWSRWMCVTTTCARSSRPDAEPLEAGARPVRGGRRSRLDDRRLAAPRAGRRPCSARGRRRTCRSR